MIDYFNNYRIYQGGHLEGPGLMRRGRAGLHTAAGRLPAAATNTNNSGNAAARKNRLNLTVSKRRQL
jgi:hypothetical protein